MIALRAKPSRPTAPADMAVSLLDHPAYREEFNRLNAVRNDYRNVKARISEVESRLANLGRATVREEAARLLDGETRDDDRPTLREELQRLHRTETVLREAVAQQTDRLAQVRHQASRELLKPLVPQYRDLVQRMADAAAALAELADEEALIRAQWTDDDIAFTGSITPLPLHDFQVSTGYQTKVLFWLSEAVKHYGVTVPEHVRRKL